MLNFVYPIPALVFFASIFAKFAEMFVNLHPALTGRIRTCYAVRSVFYVIRHIIFLYMSNETKRVYLFGDGKAEGNAEMRNLLGGKGANLAEMNLLGMPVPPGFTITTEVCNEYTQYGRDHVVGLIRKDVEKAIAHV